MKLRKKKISRRGIYLLPNLLTTAALFAGFYAIIAATKGQFEPAAIAVIAAMILDGLDGRVARWTNTQSDFGAEYDSLADLISFGLAPSMIMYEYALSHMGKLGWVAAFVYTAGAALRLARFNTQADNDDKNYFQGLPSPSAAGILVGFVWVCVEYLPADNSSYINVIYIIGMLITVSVGVLMVSNVRYNSFKNLNLGTKVPFVVIVAIMMALAITYTVPELVLFGAFSAYAITGLFFTLAMLRKRRAERRQQAKRSDSQNI